MSMCLWRLERVVVGSSLRPRLTETNLEILPGVSAVLGPSGAGKTTLLNLLVEFERPERGELRRNVVPEPQQLAVFWAPPAEGLWPDKTVYDHLAIVHPESGTGLSVERLLELFDLSDKSGSLPDHLSQGERSRLSLARALSSEAKVLVLDEPLVHVEPARLRHYWEVVQSLRRPGSSLVFSTHQPELVLPFAQHVICLAEGRVVHCGSAEQLYREPPSAELAWYLGPANWLEPGDCQAWLGITPPAGPCVRPGSLRLETSADSPLLVDDAWDAGGLAECCLRHEVTGEKRHFLHRGGVSGLSRGTRVRLSLAGIVLLVCGIASGCGGTTAGGDLPVQQIANWVLPVDDIKVPAPRAVHAAGAELYVLDNVGRVLVYNDQGELLRNWWMPEFTVGRPERICLLPDGRLAIADTHYFRVVFFDTEGNDRGRLGGFGRDPGQFIYPVAVACDDAGNLYVCEYGGNDRVQKFAPDGRWLLSMGSFGTEPGQFQRPSGMVCRGDRLYIVDAFNNRIQVFSTAGEFLEILGGEKGAAAAALQYPYDIALSPADELYVVEYGAGRVSRFDLSGQLLGRFGSTGRGSGQFTTPWGLAVDRNSRVYVADTGNRRLVQVKL